MTRPYPKDFICHILTDRRTAPKPQYHGDFIRDSLAKELDRSISGVRVVRTVAQPIHCFLSSFSGTTRDSRGKPERASANLERPADTEVTSDPHDGPGISLYRYLPAVKQ